MSSAHIGDFYLLPFADHEAKIHFICKLTEKALNQGHQIYICCPDSAVGVELDALLYSFRADSFLPHLHLTTGQNPGIFEQSSHPIIIGPELLQSPVGWVVINLNEAPYLQTFRVAEVVLNEASSKSLSRIKYSLYKQHKFELRTHKL